MHRGNIFITFFISTFICLLCLYRENNVQSLVKPSPNNVYSNDTIILSRYDTIVLKGDINMTNALKVIDDMENLKSHHKSNIYMYIDTYGGEIVYAQHIINMMTSIKYYKSITCIAVNAMSAGFSVFQACDNRYVLSQSNIMQHQVKINIIDTNLEDASLYLEQIKKLTDHMDTMDAIKIGINVDEFRNLIKDEWKIIGEDNVTHGTADKVMKITWVEN